MIPPEMLSLMLQQVLSTDEGRENATTSIAAFLSQIGIVEITFSSTDYPGESFVTVDMSVASREILARIANLTD